MVSIKIKDILDTLELHNSEDAYAVYDNVKQGYLEGYRGVVADKEKANHYTYSQACLIVADENRQCINMHKAPAFSAVKCKGKFKTFFIDE